MNQQECIQLLECHGIKPTANRMVVAKALMQMDSPMSLSELEYRILSIDRSSLFRVLTLFREHHLVHTIDDGSGGGVLYEMCHSHGGETDDDLHVHFYCERCHRLECLYEIPVPQVRMPDGYQAVSANYVIKGLCAECCRKTGGGKMS